MYALALQGVVQMVSATKPATSPLYAIIDATAYPGVAKGWIVNADGTLSGPPARSAPLSEAKATQIANLRLACAAKITGGFTSMALGDTHAYPSGDKDQQNLAASVMASLLPSSPPGWTTPFWCADLAGVWSFAPHTAAQIQQVGSDAKAMVVAAQQQLLTLTTAVLAATSSADVQACVWT